MTTFYCLRFESPLTWRARSPYLYPPGSGWPGYTPRHWVEYLPWSGLTSLHSLPLDNNWTATEERCFLRGPCRDVISRTSLKLQAVPIPGGQAGTAWEPSKPEIWFVAPPPNVVSFTTSPTFSLALSLFQVAGSEWGVSRSSVVVSCCCQKLVAEAGDTSATRRKRNVLKWRM
jgi:hypothetical protein